MVEEREAEEAAAIAETEAETALAAVGITPEIIQAKIQEIADEVPVSTVVDEPATSAPVELEQTIRVPAPPTKPVHVQSVPLTVVTSNSEMVTFSDNSTLLRQRPMHAIVKIPPMMTPDRCRFVFQVGDAIEECQGKLQSDGPAQVG
jgi:hypothetical protein